MVHKHYNLKKINEIAQGDHEFIREMLETFVENVTTEIARIQSFRPAKNWTAIGETAHKLASNFAYLGAQNLQTLALDIEKSVLTNNNLTGISGKVDQMCSDSIALVSELKKDFCISSKS